MKKGKRIGLRLTDAQLQTIEQAAQVVSAYGLSNSDVVRAAIDAGLRGGAWVDLLRLTAAERHAVRNEAGQLELF